MSPNTERPPGKTMEVMPGAKTQFGDKYAVNQGLMFSYEAKTAYKQAIASAYEAFVKAPNDTAEKL